MFWYQKFKVDWGICLHLLFPEVTYQLLGLADVEHQVVLCAPICEVLNPQPMMVLSSNLTIKFSWMSLLGGCSHGCAEWTPGAWAHTCVQKCRDSLSTNPMLFSRCMKAEWRTVETASSAILLAQNSNLVWVQAGCDAVCDVLEEHSRGTSWRWGWAPENSGNLSGILVISWE